MLKEKLKPLYPKAVNDNFFKQVQFDDKSKSSIAISIKGPKIFKKQAVVNWVPISAVLISGAAGQPVQPEDSSVTPLIARSKPGLPLRATSAEIEAGAKMFGGLDQIVIAKDTSSAAGTGIVHAQTIEQVERNEPELENVRNSKFKYIAMSFEVTDEEGKTVLKWLNRSAQNMQLYKRDKLALACLTFSPDKDNVSFHEQYTLAYNLNRSIPETDFMKYLEAAEKDLNIPCIPGDCYSFEAERTWNQILDLEGKDQEEVIRELLMTNIYIASSLPADPEKIQQHPPRNGYELDLITLFSVAKEYEIPIDPDFIPDKFIEETKNATPLIMAAKGGYARIAELLIENKADLNKKDNDGDTALTWAVRNANIDIVKLIIKHSPSVDENKIDWSQRDGFGCSPAHRAAEKGDVGALRYFVEKKIDFDLQDNYGRTPAYLAAQNGHLEALMYLAAQDNNLNKSDIQGRTIAHIAAERGDMKMLGFLAEMKVDLNQSDKYGSTPASSAKSGGHKDAQEFLAEQAVIMSMKRESAESPSSTSGIAKMLNMQLPVADSTLQVKTNDSGLQKEPSAELDNPKLDHLQPDQKDEPEPDDEPPELPLEPKEEPEPDDEPPELPLEPKEEPEPDDEPPELPQEPEEERPSNRESFRA